MASIQLKTSAAQLIYTIDWTQDIPDDVTLESVVYTIDAPMAVVDEQIDQETGLSTVELSGGVHAGRYYLDAEATLSDGEVIPAGFIIRILNGG